ncbi:tripartite tricarboxylate transporter TctB family protein [Ancylobacter sp. 6x-1]|uniref:Tripartite tricarboxylate transporter TctB family protein n=1 Tax=Ancylobacter crimeensis TaxID=2579147 RepID=A0ABT0D880_9HYPH|nr:tripartite tricarboxylate transporter TctB family protein [Ancylobacter crimeensis]MCK0196168.1 tripartite tricarboxylate transporter TctB family protein [Ancylobacter crimeensis]
MSEPSPIVRSGPDTGRLVIAAGLAVVAAVVGWEAWRLSAVDAFSAVGPAAFPTIIAIGLAILAVANTVEALRGIEEERPRDEIGPMAWVLAGLVGQIVLLTFAGFAIATGWLFAATARGFGRGPLWAHFLAGTVLCLFIYLVFALGLQLSLPAGPLEHAVGGAIQRLLGALFG